MSNINDKKKSSNMKHDSMRQFCTANETCSDVVENSECKWMTCKCKPGLSYHHATRKCLPGMLASYVVDPVIREVLNVYNESLM